MSDQTKEVQVEDKKVDADREQTTKQSEKVVTKTKSETTSRNSETETKMESDLRAGGKRKLHQRCQRLLGEAVTVPQRST